MKSLLIFTLIILCSFSCKNQADLSLFDGNSLSSWEHLKFPQNHPYSGGEFKVVDGAITGKQLDGSQKGGLIISKGQFSDFELTVDFNNDWGCDSGIFLRANRSGAGMQVSIDCLDGGTIGFVHGQGIGSFNTTPFTVNKTGDKVIAKDIYDCVKRDKITYACTSQEWLNAFNPSGWNTIKIRCIGKYPVITTWLNNTKIMVLNSNIYQGRYRKDISKISFDKNNVHSILGSEGHIAIQVHPGKRMTGTVRFKNFAIKKL